MSLKGSESIKKFSCQQQLFGVGFKNKIPENRFDEHKNELD
jgi:hypothetical protein